MQDERERLMEEFIITTWDALFAGPQKKLGVTDGGLCSLFTSGHSVLTETREAIESKAPGFEITEEQAFRTVLPELTERIDLDPANLRGLAREYLLRLGEIVGADLADDPLVASYGRMLEDYIAYETEHRALNDLPSRPGA